MVETGRQIDSASRPPVQYSTESMVDETNNVGVAFFVSSSTTRDKGMPPPCKLTQAKRRYANGNPASDHFPAAVTPELVAGGNCFHFDGLAPDITNYMICFVDHTHRRAYYSTTCVAPVRM